MTGYLTTHVLDTARGRPAEGMIIELFKIEKNSRTHLKTLVTNDDGRTDEQIMPAGEFASMCFASLLLLDIKFYP